MQARQAIGAGFLSTLPARGATGETFTATAYARISTHAPREGSDALAHHIHVELLTFLPTLPARGATGPAVAAPTRYTISTHAPREGSDLEFRQRSMKTQYFYPRSPRGERHHLFLGDVLSGQFLPTLPARGATA